MRINISNFFISDYRYNKLDMRINISNFIISDYRYNKNCMKSKKKLQWYYSFNGHCNLLIECSCDLKHKHVYVAYPIR